MTKKLLHEWTFWVICCRYVDRAQYEVEPIIKVSTIDNFCDYFKSLPKISDLHFRPDNRVSMALFSGDIKPAWEDISNKDGGMFTFFFNINSDEDRKKLDNAWKELLIEAVRGELDCLILNLKPDEIKKDTFDINGLVVTPKSSSGHPSYKFEIWTKGTHNISDCEKFIKHVKRYVGENIEIKFINHNSKKGK